MPWEQGRWQVCLFRAYKDDLESFCLLSWYIQVLGGACAKVYYLKGINGIWSKGRKGLMQGHGYSRLQICWCDKSWRVRYERASVEQRYVFTYMQKCNLQRLAVCYETALSILYTTALVSTNFMIYSSMKLIDHNSYSLHLISTSRSPRLVIHH